MKFKLNRTLFCIVKFRVNFVTRNFVKIKLSL